MPIIAAQGFLSSFPLSGRKMTREEEKKENIGQNASVYGHPVERLRLPSTVPSLLPLNQTLSLHVLPSLIHVHPLKETETNAQPDCLCLSVCMCVHTVCCNVNEVSDLHTHTHTNTQTGARQCV